MFRTQKVEDSNGFQTASHCLYQHCPKTFLLQVYSSIISPAIFVKGSKDEELQRTGYFWPLNLDYIGGGRGGEASTACGKHAIGAWRTMRRARRGKGIGTVFCTLQSADFRFGGTVRRRRIFDQSRHHVVLICCSGFACRPPPGVFASLVRRYWFRVRKSSPDMSMFRERS